MSITSTYSVTPITTSREYTTVDELLNQLPDNTGNQIDAIHVRDAVYTLWERIADVQTVASQSASASVLYTNLTPTPTSIGGIAIGSTFSSKTMQEMWDKLLYPYIAPGRSISVSGSTWTTLGIGNTKEWGDPDNLVPLSWSVVKNTNSITNITVDGGAVTPTGNNQAGTKPSTPPGTSTATINSGGTFVLTVSDDGGISNYNASVTVGYQHAVYWGKWPNNTSIPTYSGWAGSGPAYTPIKPSWADGASYGTGKKLSTTLVGTYDGVDGAGQYLVFAWPTSFGIPKFQLYGLTNTAFTKIGKAIGFVNRFSFNSGGGGIPYDIWITNTAQNASIGDFKILQGTAADWPPGVL